MARRVISWVLLVAGGLFVAAAIPAGYLNRTVLDAPTFAERVDELRRRDDVSAVLGAELSRQLLVRNPDLVAVAPLLETVSVGVVRSEVLSGPIKVATAQFHRALTTDESAQLVLRVADVGAVVAGVFGAIAPERAPRATDVSLTLADIGNQTFAADVIRLADLVGTLAWLFPLVGLLCLVGVVLLDRDRWNGVRRVGWAVVGGAAGLVAALVAGGALSRAAGGSERSDALIDGAWEVFVRPIWWPIALLASVGFLLVLIGSGRAGAWRLGDARRWLAERPARPGAVVAKALAMVALGVALIAEPAGVITVVVFVVGLLLVAAGVSTLGRLASPASMHAGGEGDAAANARRSGRVRLLVVAGLGVAVLAGLVVWAAGEPSDQVAGAVDGAVSGEGEVCNGHETLCDLPFDSVSYAATHNSMAVAGRPGWFLGEQGLDIVPQLDFGVRALLVDVWYGHDAGGGRVRTSARSYAEALAVAEEELGPEVVAAALRVVDAVAPGEPQGEEALFMCHGLCETGATSFDTTLRQIRVWLETHPDEVLSIFVEDHVDAADVAASVTAAGLAPYAFTPVQGEAFPTLGEMIRSGKRLLVMLEEGDGDPDAPWLVNGFEFVQETPYTFPTADSFTCDENRGRPDAPLLQINHWVAGFTDLVTSAQLVNTADVLGARVLECREQRDMQPTFVAVNYADIGDLIAVVDQLNGVG